MTAMRRYRMNKKHEILQHNYDIIEFHKEMERRNKKAKLSKEEFVARFLVDQKIRQIIEEVRKRERGVEP